MDALQMSLELIIGFPEHVEIIDDLAETSWREWMIFKEIDNNNHVKVGTVCRYLLKMSQRCHNF